LFSLSVTQNNKVTFGAKSQRTKLDRTKELDNKVNNLTDMSKLADLPLEDIETQIQQLEASVSTKEEKLQALLLTLFELKKETSEQYEKAQANYLQSYKVVPCATQVQTKYEIPSDEEINNAKLAQQTLFQGYLH
jgi:hypothetical protein